MSTNESKIKTALVTGASRGFGRAIAKALHDRGLRVVGVARNHEQLDTLGFWWLIYPAGLAIVLTVVAFNFIGDALRDALEVRLQER